MKDYVEIIFNPTQKNIDEINKWSNEKSALYSSFKSKTLIIAKYMGVAVGFCSFEIAGITLHIHSSEVKKDFKLNGIGRRMNEELERKFKDKYFAITLYCSPKNSRFFWKKLGFEYFPENNNLNEIYMFKPLKDISENLADGKVDKSDEIIIIFGDNNVEYKWKLEFKENSRMLNCPIVFFGFCEWKMLWKKGEEIFYNDSYKYFNRKQKIDECMFINELPLNN